MIQVTLQATAEIKRMMESKKDKAPNLGLRVSVKGGGCSGLSYSIDFDVPKEKDQVFDFAGLTVYCDPKSFLYLDGMALDYADTLQDKGFKFVNPNASKTCGCGESFSV
jgi:iron-sulfur cluster assembly protein